MQLVSYEGVNKWDLILIDIQSLMNKAHILAALLAVLAALALYQHSAPSSYTFEQFQTEYSKNYLRIGEAEYRKVIFLRNLAKIETHNADSTNTYQLGVNQFADLTDAEFKALYLTLTVPKDFKRNVVLNQKNTPIVGDIDWVAQGKVSGVKNQGSCGSCWAFSATGAIESALLINGQDTLVSDQELVDCSRSYGNMGCNGGWMDSAFQYVIDNKIAAQSDYPYTARDQQCQGQIGSRTSISSFVDVPFCEGLANSLQSRPVSVAVDASNWSLYRGGVLSVCGTAINHGVLVVGSTDDYWKVKNSWGNTWGESGFIRLKSGNTCDVCSYASYPTL